MHPDLTPATETLARVVTGIGDDQLGAPTPCRGMTVADVLDHVDGLCLAFTGAAAKTWTPAARRRPPTGRGCHRTGGRAYLAAWRISRLPGAMSAPGPA